MKTLVTGCGGYVGSYLLSLLKSRGTEVCALTSKEIPEVDCHRVDWNSAEELGELLSRLKPERIFHLVGSREAKPTSELLRINALFTSHLLDAMEATHTKVPLLVMGSAAEYGAAPADTQPLSEATPLQPASPYGTAKAVQSLIVQYAASKGMPVVNARVFNPIGPRMPKELVVGHFCAQLNRVRRDPNARIQMGDLRSSRDVIDVHDLVDILTRLLDEPRSYGQTVNICTGRAVKISDLLSRILKANGPEVEIGHRNGDAPPTSIVGSPKRLLALIGDYEFTPLDDSIETIARAIG